MLCLSKTMKKLLTILLHPFFILCKNVFVLVETTANPEVIDDLIKVLLLSKISDDCKNALIKNRVLKSYISFHLKYIKIVKKNLVEKDHSVYVNSLIILTFYHTRSQ